MEVTVLKGILRKSNIPTLVNMDDIIMEEEFSDDEGFLDYFDCFLLNQ